MHLIQLLKELSLQPQSTQELRGLILDLAIRGRLTKEWREEHPEVEPAATLLERIEREKARLVKEKIIRKSKYQLPLTEEEISFPLPKNWVWCRLANLVVLRSGTTFKKSEELSKGDYLYIKVGTMNLPGNEELITTSDMYIQHNPKVEKALIPPNSIIFPKRGGAIATNKKRIVKSHILVDLNTMALTPLYEGIFHYIKIWFDSVDLWILNSGTSVPQINNKDIEPLPIPLPPLAEQKAIVEIVDQLLAEVDALEAQLQQRVQLKEDYVTAALRQLTRQAPAPAWAALQPHFKRAFDTPGSVEQLRQAILQLAVQGQLTAPWRRAHPDTEPAGVLLEQIQAEKARLVQEKQIKKQKALPPIEAEEVPFELPEGWVWCRLGEVTTIGGGKRVPAGYKLKKVPTPHIYLRVSDMKNGSVDDSNLHYIDKHLFEKIQRYTISKDELYMTIVGATIGKSGLIPPRFDGVNLTENAAKIRPLIILKEYIKVAFDSSLMQDQFIDKTKQVGVQKMALYRFKSSALPLPPLAEQKAIVALVDDLLGACDRLGAGLEEREGLLGDLMKASVREVRN